VETKKAMREHTAPQEATKLLLDEARCRLSSACGAPEKSFQVLANDTMEERLLRLVPFVVGHAVPLRDRRGEAPLRTLGAHRGCSKSVRGARGMQRRTHLEPAARPPSQSTNTEKSTIPASLELPGNETKMARRAGLEPATLRFEA
jgi:hypothetical protein